MGDSETPIARHSALVKSKLSGLSKSLSKVETRHIMQDNAGSGLQVEDMQSWTEGRVCVNGVRSPHLHVTEEVADGDIWQTSGENSRPDDSLREVFKKQVALSGVTCASWTEDNDKALDKFIMDTSIPCLIVYLDPYVGLLVDYKAPPQLVEQLAYFIRDEGKPITVETVQNTVQFGSMCGNSVENLLHFMAGVHVPQVILNSSWPESIKNDYFLHLNRFLMQLTDTKFKQEGQTVLFIPMEALQFSPEVAAKDWEIVKRLEMVIIHWTRQIKEVLHAQEIMKVGDDSGPLEEIDFWRSRCTNLSAISQQLQKTSVRHIQTTLELAKSSYVAPFIEQAKQLEHGSLQAKSNLSFLSLLREPFEELSQLKPHEVAPKLIVIIQLIRVIWINSPHYNTREKITTLFRKVSNDIIRLCSQEISLDQIFDGYVVSSKEILNDCIQCCLAWKENYIHISQALHKYSGKSWVLDQTNIFAVVDAFVQRCKDLLEVCFSQHHFARHVEGNQELMPCFGGRQGDELTHRLQDIEGIFSKNLWALRSMSKGILDVKNSSWQDAYNCFRAAMKDLEMMMQNLITKAFETVKRVEEGVELINIFEHLSAREALKRTIDKKAADMYDLFSKELNLVNEELACGTVDIPLHMPYYAGRAYWARFLRQRIERPMEILQEADFIPRVGCWEEVRLAYAQLVQTLDELVDRFYREWCQSLDQQSLKRLGQPLMVHCKDMAGMLDVIFSQNLLNMFHEVHYWKQLLFEIPHYVLNVYQHREELCNLQENILLMDH